MHLKINMLTISKQVFFIVVINPLNKFFDVHAVLLTTDPMLYSKSLRLIYPAYKQIIF